MGSRLLYKSQYVFSSSCLYSTYSRAILQVQWIQNCDKLLRFLHNQISEPPSTCLFVEPTNNNSKKPHTPVMALELLKALQLKKKSTYLDMTFGSGGHSQLILEATPSATIYGLDRDPITAQFGSLLEEKFPGRFFYMNGKFRDLPALLHQRGIGGNFFNGVFMDLGASSMQFDSPERGFMLSQNGPLDMRMDGHSSDTPTAAQILQHIDEESLYKVLKYYGEEKKARVIAKALVEHRTYLKSLTTTKELAEFVSSVIGVERRLDKIQRFSHPATKTFQALRILVNNELNELDYGIRLAHFYLQLEGVLAVIAFHSLEDAVVKRHFVGLYLNDLNFLGSHLKQHQNSYLSTYSSEELETVLLKPWKPLTKRVVLPSEQEIEYNPRARSAKLRIGSKESFDPY